MILAHSKREAFIVLLGLLLPSLGRTSDTSSDLNSIEICATKNNINKTFANIWQLYNEFKTSGQLWIPVATGACPVSDIDCTLFDPVCAISSANFFKTFPNQCVLEAEKKATGSDWKIVLNGICSLNPADGFVDSSASRVPDLGNNALSSNADDMQVNNGDSAAATVPSVYNTPYETSTPSTSGHFNQIYAKPAAVPQNLNYVPYSKGTPAKQSEESTSSGDAPPPASAQCDVPKEQQPEAYPSVSPQFSMSVLYHASKSPVSKQYNTVQDSQMSNNYTPSFAPSEADSLPLYKDGPSPSATRYKPAQQKQASSNYNQDIVPPLPVPSQSYMPPTYAVQEVQQLPVSPSSQSYSIKTAAEQYKTAQEPQVYGNYNQDSASFLSYSESYAPPLYKDEDVSRISNVSQENRTCSNYNAGSAQNRTKEQSYHIPSNAKQGPRPSSNYHQESGLRSDIMSPSYHEPLQSYNYKHESKPVASTSTQKYSEPSYNAMSSSGIESQSVYKHNRVSAPSHNYQSYPSPLRNAAPSLVAGQESQTYQNYNNVVGPNPFAPPTLQSQILPLYNMSSVASARDNPNEKVPETPAPTPVRKVLISSCNSYQSSAHTPSTQLVTSTSSEAPTSSSPVYYYEYSPSPSPNNLEFSSQSLDNKQYIPAKVLPPSPPDATLEEYKENSQQLSEYSQNAALGNNCNDPSVQLQLSTASPQYSHSHVSYSATNSYGQSDSDQRSPDSQQPNDELYNDSNYNNNVSSASRQPVDSNTELENCPQQSNKSTVDQQSDMDVTTYNTSNSVLPTQTEYSSNMADGDANAPNQSNEGQTIYSGTVYQGPYYYEPKYRHINFGNFNFLPSQNLGTHPVTPVVPPLPVASKVYAVVNGEQNLEELLRHLQFIALIKNKSA